MTSRGRFLFLMVFLTGLVLLAAAQAAETNFSPANMSGDAPYEGEWKSRAARAESTASGAQEDPTFWQKEYERSGLQETSSKVQGFIGGVFGGLRDPRAFFREQKDRYLARKRGEAT